MIRKKIVTSAGLKLLYAIMQTCPATPFNGGEHAKKHLEKLCENGVDILGQNLCDMVDKKLFCDCEGDIEIDVYSHLLESTNSELIDKLEVMEYFGSDIHAEKIFSNTRKDGLPQKYSLKVVFGHLLVPVVIKSVDNISAVDSDGVVIDNLLILDGDDSQYAIGDIVLMHYGFIVGKITQLEMEQLDSINKKSMLYHESMKVINNNMDFATMHYFPRSKKMAGKQ
jgi:hydrogenase maturation factor